MLLDTLTWAEALVIAIILAPTDAALGQAVVTMPRLPVRVRQSLNVESGLNDGICVPLFLIALAIAQAEEGAIGHGHAVELVFEKIGYGILGGVVAGAAAAFVVVYAGGRRLVDESWLQIVPLAGALLAFGLAEAIGGSGFIGAFVGGGVFGGLRRGRGGDVSYLLEQVGAVLGATTFVVFGAVLLGPAIGDLTWQIALYAVLSLTVIRMLPVAVAMLGSGARRPTVAFLGWFGPRGAASIVFALLVVEEGGLPHDEVHSRDRVRHRRPLGARPRRHRGAARLALRELARRQPARGSRAGRGGRRQGAPVAPLACPARGRGARVIAVSKEEARRIAVRAQLLDGSATSLLDTVRRLGYLQIDPISTVAPPQYLVPWSRLGPYDTAELDSLLWTEKKLFEWNAFIWPIEDLPLAQARMRRRRGEVHIRATRERVPRGEQALQAVRAPRARGERADALARDRGRCATHVDCARLVRKSRRRRDARDPPRPRPRRSRG